MKIVLDLKSLEDAKTFFNRIQLAEEESHDIGDYEDEALFIDLQKQIKKQMDDPDEQPFCPENFLENIKEINKAFDKNIIWNPIYQTEIWWIAEGELRWSEEDDDISDGDHRYSAEIKGGIKEIDDWTAIYVKSDIGDCFWAIYKNENRRRDLEE